MQKRVVVLCCLAVAFSASAVFASTPEWVNEFRLGALRLSQISHGDTWQHPQPSLKILETKGKGNCVAWSKFMAKISLKHRVEFKHYIIAENRKDEKAKDSHQITVLRDDSGQLWMQSNEKLKKVKDLKEVMRMMDDEFGSSWKNGCHITTEFTVLAEDLYDETGL